MPQKTGKEDEQGPVTAMTIAGRRRRRLRGATKAAYSDISRVADPNELIRVNIIEIHILLEAETDLLHEQGAKFEAEIEELEKERITPPGQMIKARKVYSQWRNDRLKNIQKLMATEKQLAAEYRQSASLHRQGVPLKKVMEFATAVKNAIERHVHNQLAREKISREIAESVAGLSAVGQHR